MPAATPSGPARLPRATPALLAALLATALLASGCASAADPPTTVGAGDPGPLHVHGLGVDPGNGRLHVATHTGLWRLDPDGGMVRVGDTAADFMGFTVVGPGHFLASGHPDLRTDLPPLLGLIESTDAGRTWEPVSRLGEADFHALRAAHGRVHAWSATDETFAVSEDRQEWDTRGTLSLADFVVHPDLPETVLAAGTRTADMSGVARSDDGGRTWGAVAGPALHRLAWRERDRLFGVDGDGTVWRSVDEGATWERTGTVGSAPVALLDAEDALYVATESGLLASTDDGATWRVRFDAGHDA